MTSLIRIMFISVIIPAYNEEKYLGRTINNIRAAFKDNSHKNLSWELIVCDNNSNDKTGEIASKKNAKVVFEPHNQIAKARNTGAKFAKGNWFLFVDADTYPTPELVSEVLKLLGSNRYVGFGTTVEVRDGTLFNKLRMERLNPIFRLLNLSGGAFLLCEKQAFININGFSENLYAYEEIEFIYRLKKYGRKHGRKFKVLHRHPVITSGRKGDHNMASIAQLIVSNVAAFTFLILHGVLPAKIFNKIGNRLLGYWYRHR